MECFFRVNSKSHKSLGQRGRKTLGSTKWKKDVALEELLSGSGPHNYQRNGHQLREIEDAQSDLKSLPTSTSTSNLNLSGWTTKTA